jgi:hypothetical protein
MLARLALYLSDEQNEALRSNLQDISNRNY